MSNCMNQALYVYASIRQRFKMGYLPDPSPCNMALRTLALKRWECYLPFQSTIDQRSLSGSCYYQTHHRMVGIVQEAVDC